MSYPNEDFRADGKNKFGWLISAALMLILAAALIIFSRFILSARENKYSQRLSPIPEIISYEEIDIDGFDKELYNLRGIKKGFDADGNLAAYIVKTFSEGYHGKVVVETAVTPDAKYALYMKVTSQDETEGLGELIIEEPFASQFDGIQLPVHLSMDGMSGAQIDGVSRATYSSRAVVEAVNLAQSLVKDFFK